MAQIIKAKSGEDFIWQGKQVFGLDTAGSIKAVNVEARTMDMVGSTEVKDRDGDVIVTSGWKLENFMKNPVFLWGHDYSSVPLAAVKTVIKRKNPEPHLFFKDIRYPRKSLFPFADMVLELYGEKIINASSVGFIPFAWEDIELKEGELSAQIHWKGRKYIDQELLELSGCAIPSNPSALQNMLTPYAQKSFGGVPGEELTKFIMTGRLFVPDKTDDILNDLNVRPLEFVDETESKVYQVPRSLPHEDEEEETKTIDLLAIEKKSGEVKILVVGEVKEKTIYKSLDVEHLNVPAASYLFDTYAKFLSCSVKDIYNRDIIYPHPLVGTALKGLAQWIIGGVERKEIKQVDVRNLTPQGEVPPSYDEIQLNSKEAIEVMVYGTYFIRGTEGWADFIIRLCPSWEGINLEVYSNIASKEKIKDAIGYVQKYVDENNFLKGEKFSLTGQFLKLSSTGWDDLILDKDIIDPVKRNVDLLLKKKENFASRGLLFAGPPGTGKTLSGRAMKDTAEEATFIWISAKDFARMNSIGAVRMAYRMARQLAPTILFFEDIDQWMHGFMIDVFKTEMDGLEINKGILTVLTSNSPNKLPRSLIDRPGRFHEILIFDLPNKDLRAEMLKKWGVEKVSDELLEKMKGFSGAHMKEMVELARQIAEEEEMPLANSLEKALKKVLAQRELVVNLEDYDSMKAVKTISEKTEVPLVSASLPDETIEEEEEVFKEIFEMPAPVAAKKPQEDSGQTAKVFNDLSALVKQINETLKTI